MRSLLTRLGLALALLLILPGLAAAHAELATSDPAAGANIPLAQAPTKITLTFTEELSKGQETVTVMSGGTDYAGDAPTLDFDNPKLLTVPLKPLKAGTYTVNWHTVTADDNGISNGQFSFTITEPASPTGGDVSAGTTGTQPGTTPPGNTNTLPSTGHGNLPDAGFLLAGALLLLLLGGMLRWRQVV